MFTEHTPGTRNFPGAGETHSSQNRCHVYSGGTSRPRNLQPRVKPSLLLYGLQAKNGFEVSNSQVGEEIEEK